ncbi:MAG: hypothetical protein AB1391_00630 [Candidatus Micrarchaeota archaeon]
MIEGEISELRKKIATIATLAITDIAKIQGEIKSDIEKLPETDSQRNTLSNALDEAVRNRIKTELNFEKSLASNILQKVVTEIRKNFELNAELLFILDIELDEGIKSEIEKIIRSTDPPFKKGLKLYTRWSILTKLGIPGDTTGSINERITPEASKLLTQLIAEAEPKVTNAINENSVSKNEEVLRYFPLIIKLNGIVKGDKEKEINKTISEQITKLFEIVQKEDNINKTEIISQFVGLIPSLHGKKELMGIFLHLYEKKIDITPIPEDRKKFIETFKTWNVEIKDLAISGEEKNKLIIYLCEKIIKECDIQSNSDLSSYANKIPAIYKVLEVLKSITGEARSLTTQLIAEAETKIDEIAAKVFDLIQKDVDKNSNIEVQKKIRLLFDVIENAQEFVEKYESKIQGQLIDVYINAICSRVLQQGSVSGRLNDPDAFLFVAIRDVIDQLLPNLYKFYKCHPEIASPAVYAVEEDIETLYKLYVQSKWAEKRDELKNGQQASCWVSTEGLEKIIREEIDPKIAKQDMQEIKELLARCKYAITRYCLDFDKRMTTVEAIQNDIMTKTDAQPLEPTKVRELILRIINGQKTLQLSVVSQLITQKLVR